MGSKGSVATRKPAPLNKPWSVEEPEAILDYLHADIPDGEVKACCYYEYSRASQVLRKASREILRKVPRKYDPANAEDLLRRIGGFIPTWLQDWLQGWRLEILICPGYPKLPWRELNEAQRKDILVSFVKPRPTPLITDVRILNAMQVFDRFKQQAKDARGFKKAMVWGSHCPAIAGDDEIKHVVVTINYKEGIGAVKESFSSWLGSEANHELFKKYYKKPIHKQNPASPVRYKELLKYLAAWRLYDELRFKKAANWTKKNRRPRTDRSGIVRMRPFFGEKQSKRKHGLLLVESPLYKDPRDWKAARTAAQSFLPAEIECVGMG